MSMRNDQCKKVCQILDDVLANRPQERDALIVAVQKAFDALADDGWIPVEKRLPDNSDTVLVTHRSGVYIAWYNGRYWERGASTKHREIRTVTAWRPFPPAFRQKEDK